MDGVLLSVIGTLVTVLLTGVGFMLTALNNKVNKLEAELKTKADISSLTQMGNDIKQILHKVVEIQLEQAEWRGRRDNQLSNRSEKS